MLSLTMTQLIKTDLPTILLPWLIHQGPLTDKLRREAGVARLQVLRQQWHKPDWWDKYTLQLRTDTVMHREILMWSASHPCWYARTILPQASYLHDPGFFDRLNNETLGKLIFANPRVERISLTHYPINPQLIEYYWLTAAMHGDSQQLWVRKSRFVLDGGLPFFLIEILLPGLERACM